MGLSSQLNDALIEAVDAHDVAAVHQLLEAGADTAFVERYEDGTVWSVLDSAVPGPPEILLMLIQHGASADACIGGDGNSPLHRAAEHGNLETLRLLLTSGATQCLRTFDYIDQTPLHLAAEAGNGPAVSMLLEAGAEVNAHNPEHRGETALGQVAETCTVLMAQILCNAGADPHRWASTMLALFPPFLFVSPFISYVD